MISQLRPQKRQSLLFGAAILLWSISLAQVSSSAQNITIQTPPDNANFPPNSHVDVIGRYTCDGAYNKIMVQMFPVDENGNKNGNVVDENTLDIHPAQDAGWGIGLTTANVPNGQMKRYKITADLTGPIGGGAITLRVTVFIWVGGS